MSITAPSRSGLSSGPGRHLQPSGLTGQTGLLAITTEGLTKRYGDRTVVDDLNLRVPAGVVSGFVGPNGAGKTTTIRMLLGLVRSTSGTGTMLDRPLSHPEKYLKQVGAMIEGPAFHPTLSGLDNLRLLARAGSLPVSRVRTVLERVGLADRGSSAFRSYSLGMKQRLGIAAALLPDPKLLILDEPTNGLDPAGIVSVRDLMHSLNADGLTVLVSSHLLAEVEQVASHLVMIREGRLVFQGSVSDLVSARAAELLAAGPSPDDNVTIRRLATELGWAARLDGLGGSLVRIELPTGDDGPESLMHAAELNRRAHQAGVVLSRLELHRPTLEQAFFDLTGTTSGDVR